MDSGVRRAGAAAGTQKRLVTGWDCPGRGRSDGTIKEKPSQPRASMPGGLPRMGLSPGVELVPGVGASLRGVGVLDFRPGVEDLSFCGGKGGERGHSHYPAKQALQTDKLRANPNLIQSNSDNPHGPAQP